MACFGVKKNNSLPRISEWAIIYLYFMEHLIQLSLVLGYLIKLIDFIKDHLSQTFIVSLRFIISQAVWNNNRIEY